MLLIATGRVPNGDTLDLRATGVEVDDDGYVVVDEHQRTTAEGIFALGDVSSHHQLKHVANHEARVVQHNLLHPDALIGQRPPVRPARGVHRAAGRLGRADRARRRASRASTTPSATATTATPRTAGRWRTPTTSSRCSPTAATGRLLGAHLIGPQASSMIQPLIQAMSFGLTAHEWPGASTGSTRR